MAIYRWKEDEKVTVKIDEKKENRYFLNCSWDVSKPGVTFLLINPSDGNEEFADRTLRRCADFSRDWNYGSMKVVNLYSQITSKTDKLRLPTIDESRENNTYIMKAISDSERVIFGWGELEREFKDRVKEVKALVPLEKQFCIKKTANGLYPRHPLFLSKELTPISMSE